MTIPDLLCGDAIDCRVTMRFDDHLDRILDPFAGITQSSRKVLKSERVGVNLRGIKTLLCHESLGAMGSTLAFAADAKHVYVVPHEVGDVDFGRLARKCRQTDAATAVQHARSFAYRVRSARTFDVVTHALAH